MVNEMDTTQYIQWLKTFEFSAEQQNMLLALPPKQQNKDKLTEALPLIEQRIRAFIFDYRKEVQDPLLEVTTFLENSCLEADRVCNSIQTLVNDLDDLSFIKDSREEFLKLSLALKRYIAVLKAAKEYDIPPPQIKMGRPRKHYLRWLAIDIGSCLRASGINLTKSKTGLFCEVYIQIARSLDVELTEPTNYIEEAIAYLDNNSEALLDKEE